MKTTQPKGLNKKTDDSKGKMGKAPAMGGRKHVNTTVSKKYRYNSNETGGFKQNKKMPRYQNKKAFA